MSLQINHLAGTMVLLAAAWAPLLPAMDLSFMGQAPMRYLSPADMQLMTETIDAALEEAADGESRRWDNAESKASGTVTVQRSFEHDGMPCRRLEIASQVPQASHGGHRYLADMCRVGEDWKILALP